eukprot:TRINITY_DN5116_c0_g1_i2.p1 TRINITY_DN5116_c0_g1~~TRINITY_DN5116_c0_g1_i2.p1  ORF type:complete len:527 (+),score=116.30 TRINITY_DN5116_c0_g1_i2:66-1646(+)
MKKLLLPLLGAIDQGTSSSRFLVFDALARVVCQHQIEFETETPNPGWVEADPHVLINSVQTCIEECDRKFQSEFQMSLKDCISGVGVTNQRETTIVWDRATSKPLYPAIVWSDTRTKEIAHRIKRHLSSPTSSESTSLTVAGMTGLSGLPISSYFSALKYTWLLENVVGVKKAVDERSALFGTVDSWLIWNLTGVHVTDVSNASRTKFMNIKTCQWDDELCKFFKIPKEILPPIRSSAEIYGYFTDGPLQGIPIAGCLGDQQAALVGQKCFGVGDVKNTYGTGCFMLFNTGVEPVFSKNGLLTTVAYQLSPDSPVHYALEGSVATAGVGMRWLRDHMGLYQSYDESNAICQEVTDTGGVYFVPAFSGLFAPYWREDARGTIVGLSQYSDKRHIIRAMMEAVAYQSNDVLEAMNKDSGMTVQKLKVDGGLTNSRPLLQFQCDISQVPVVKSKNTETTAAGAAFAAGLATGVFKSVEDIANLQLADETFNPAMEIKLKDRKVRKWRRAVEKSIGWIESDDEEEGSTHH